MPEPIHILQGAVALSDAHLPHPMCAPARRGDDPSSVPTAWPIPEVDPATYLRTWLVEVPDAMEAVHAMAARGVRRAFRLERLNRRRLLRPARVTR